MPSRRVTSLAEVLPLLANSYKIPQLPANVYFFLQRPASPTLRFFAHKQTLLPQLSYPANEKFGVIFALSCLLAVLPVRAWRDSRLHSASESSGPRKPLCRSSGRESVWTGVPMGVGAKIVCLEPFWVIGDTVVQYAAYLTSSSFGERGNGIIRF